MITLGIDPGLNGGICVANGTVIAHYKMPDTIYDIKSRLTLITESQGFMDDSEIHAFIELPPWSMGINKGVGSVKLHHNRGVLEGMLVAMGFQVVNVSPQKWQKTFGLGTRSASASDTEWKNKLKAEAQRLYPKLKVTHAVADALLILTYGLRQLGDKSHP